MLDGKFVYENHEYIKTQVNKRGDILDLERFLMLWESRKKFIMQLGDLRSERNKISKMGSGQDNDIARGVYLRDTILSLEQELRLVENEIDDILSVIPNLPQDDVPLGRPEDSVVIYTSEPNKYKCDKLLDHIEIANKYNLIDFDRGSKVTGSKWLFYVGKGALLERALLNFLIDEHIKNDFLLMMPPFFVNEQTAFGAGSLPKFKDQLFYSEKDSIYAIPTAEVPLAGYHANEVLAEGALPKFYCASTPCFRREIGARASDRGLIRTHQFNKVEMFCICNPEESEAHLQTLLRYVNNILDKLGLNYRNVLLTSEDMSFASSKTIDVEVFVPSMNRFYEVSSISNCLDFQARRLNIKFRDAKNNANKYVHMLNGSGVATSRLMAAILECYQDEENRVRVPDVLVPYTAFSVIE